MPVSFNPNATFRGNGPNVKVPTKVYNGKKDPYKEEIIASQEQKAASEAANRIAKKAAKAGIVKLNISPPPSPKNDIPKFVPFNLNAFRLGQNKGKLAKSINATAPKLSEIHSPAGGKRTRRKMRKSKKTRRH